MRRLATSSVWPSGPPQRRHASWWYTATPSPRRTRWIGLSSSAASTVTMRLRRTPRRSWATSHVPHREQLVLGDRAALASGVDAEDPQHLGPVDVADPGDHAPGPAAASRSAWSTAAPAATKRSGIGVGPQRVGAELGDPGVHLARGRSMAQIAGPGQVPGVGRPDEAQPDQADRAARVATGARCHLPMSPRWTWRIVAAREVGELVLAPGLDLQRTCPSRRRRPRRSGPAATMPATAWPARSRRWSRARRWTVWPSGTAGAVAQSQPMRDRNSAVLLLCGKGSAGSGTPRAAHRGPQPSPGCHSTSRSAGTAARTAALWAS